MNVDNVLTRLSKSKFRSSFHLKEKDKNYINEKGIETITKHAYDFINKRLAPKVILNDGKQTPLKEPKGSIFVEITRVFNNQNQFR